MFFFKFINFDIMKTLNFAKKLTENQNKSNDPRLMFFFYVINLEICLNRCEIESSIFFENQANIMLKELNEPSLISKLCSLKIQRLIKEKKWSLAYESVLRLTKFNKKKGIIFFFCFFFCFKS